MYRLPVSTILEFRGAFRLTASDSQRLRGGGGVGTWICRCGAEANVTRGPRCQTHAAGGDCGRDCTTVALECPACGQRA